MSNVKQFKCLEQHMKLPSSLPALAECEVWPKCWQVTCFCHGSVHLATSHPWSWFGKLKGLAPLGISTGRKRCIDGQFQFLSKKELQRETISFLVAEHHASSCAMPWVLLVLQTAIHQYPEAPRPRPWNDMNWSRMFYDMNNSVYI